MNIIQAALTRDPAIRGRWLLPDVPLDKVLLIDMDSAAQQRWLDKDTGIISTVQTVRTYDEVGIYDGDMPAELFVVD